MNIIIIIICIIAAFWIKSSVFNKIDREEAKAHATPGRAGYIRDHHMPVVNYVLSIPNSSILFENSDSIRIGIDGENEYIVIHSDSRGLLMAHVKWSAVQKEWKFSKDQSDSQIISNLNNYLK